MLKTPIHDKIVYIARKVKCHWCYDCHKVQTLTSSGIGDAAAGLGLHILYMSEGAFSHDASHILISYSAWCHEWKTPTDIIFQPDCISHSEIMSALLISYERLVITCTIFCLLQHKNNKTLPRCLVKLFTECQTTRIWIRFLFTRHLIRFHIVCRCHYPYV